MNSGKRSLELIRASTANRLFPSLLSVFDGSVPMDYQNTNKASVLFLNMLLELLTENDLEFIWKKSDEPSKIQKATSSTLFFFWLFIALGEL